MAAYGVRGILLSLGGMWRPMAAPLTLPHSIHFTLSFWRSYKSGLWVGGGAAAVVLFYYHEGFHQ